MSRNFELMTLLEIEAGERNRRSRSSADRSAAMPFAPILSSRDSEAGGEEMLRLIQRVFLQADGRSPRQVVICGVDDQNGSSSICAQAGRTLAANCSGSVCLVDANLRSPRLRGLLGAEGASSFSGPSDHLREQCMKIGGDLWLAGPTILADNRQVLLSPALLKNRLEQLREEFEFTLIDAPGTSVNGDAQLLSLIADAVILVIEANNTRRLTARKARESLEASGARLLGTVLHNRRFPIPEELYKRL